MYCDLWSDGVAFYWHGLDPAIFEERSLQINTRMFWVIIFIRWWNTSILLQGDKSSVHRTQGDTSFAEYENDVNHILSHSLDLKHTEHLQEILEWH